MNSTASGTRLDRLSRSLTSRKGAWWWLAGAIIVILGVFGVFGQADMTTGNDQAPLGRESEQVEELLEKFPDSDEQSVLLIASRTDGADITDTDLADSNRQPTTSIATLSKPPQIRCPATTMPLR